MYFSNLILRVHFLVASLIVGAALSAEGFGQTTPGSTRLSTTVRPALPGGKQRARATRSSETEREIDRLKSEMDVLHSLLKEQQQALGTMQKRLDDLQAAQVIPSVPALTATDPAVVGSAVQVARDPATSASQVTPAPTAPEIAPGVVTPALGVARSEAKSAEPNTAHLNAAPTPNEQPSTFNLQPSAVGAPHPRPRRGHV